jgi:hypothetical protein
MNLQKKLHSYTNHEYSKWLADFSKGRSEQCLIDAHQRGMENDLELLDIKMREMTSRLSKGLPPLQQQKQEANLPSTRNTRWSTNGGKIVKDAAPNAIKRSPGLRRELCRDLDFHPSKSPVRSLSKAMRSIKVTH